MWPQRLVTCVPDSDCPVGTDMVIGLYHYSIMLLLVSVFKIIFSSGGGSYCYHLLFDGSSTSCLDGLLMSRS